MAAVDLSTELLADMAVSKLSETLAPIGAFSARAIGGEGVREVVRNTASTGGVYQVEVTNALPTAADNPSDYEAMTSGSQTNVTVSTNNIAVMQKLTNVQQSQGIPFKTAIPDAAKALGNAVWDKCTAMMGAASYTATSIGATGTLVGTDLTGALSRIESNSVQLLLERSEAGPVIPTDKDKFRLSETGAYGFDAIHLVTNFTGGVANQLALAASPEAAVYVSGLPEMDSRARQLVNSASLIESVTLPQLGLPVELRVWVNTGTKDLYLTMETVFGISEVDSTAGEVLTHA